MVVNWDHPVVVEETRQMCKKIAEELSQQGMYQRVADEWPLESPRKPVDAFK